LYKVLFTVYLLIILNTSVVFVHNKNPVIDSCRNSEINYTYCQFLQMDYDEFLEEFAKAELNAGLGMYGNSCIFPS